MCLKTQEHSLSVSCFREEVKIGLQFGYMMSPKSLGLILKISGAIRRQWKLRRGSLGEVLDH
jgi:hypothetical protein